VDRQHLRVTTDFSVVFYAGVPGSQAAPILVFGATVFADNDIPGVAHHADNFELRHHGQKGFDDHQIAGELGQENFSFGQLLLDIDSIFMIGVMVNFKTGNHGFSEQCGARAGTTAYDMYSVHVAECRQIVPLLLLMDTKEVRRVLGDSGFPSCYSLPKQYSLYW